MKHRALSSIALGLAVLVSLVACTPKPAAPPPRARAQDDRPVARRAESPPPPAPRGPQIRDRLLATFRLGSIRELDRRIGALVPSMVPAPFVQGLVTRRLLPELVRELGINALVLEAVDFTRPAVLGLLVSPATRKRPVPVPRVVALLPLRGDPGMVMDGLKISFPESREERWGGLQLRVGDKTVSWVHAHGRWVAVAPTAPLLDSARRTLEPLADGVEEGSLRAEIAYARLLGIYRPAIAAGWKQLRSRLGANGGPGGSGGVLPGPLEGLVRSLAPMAERLAPYLASLERVEVVGRIADDGWSFRLKVTPTSGGKAAEWVGSLRSPGRFGMDLLPPEAAVVNVDWAGPDARILAAQVYEQMTHFAVETIVSRDLPAQVKERGLMDRKGPATLEQYRRTLRDLNLEDYRASYAVYKLLFDVQSLRKLVTGSVARLVQATTGEGATALYASGGHLGVGRVQRVRQVAGHRAAMMALAVGLERQGNALLSSLWEAVPLETRDQLGMRANPLRLVFNPVALQAGRTVVSSIGLRMRWPAPPAGAGAGAGAGGAQPFERRMALEKLEKVRAIAEHLLGKGDVTVAWAYVGDRVISSMGHDWAKRMRAMLERSRPGAGRPDAVLTDPPVANALRDVSGDSVSLTVVSFGRLILAGIELAKVLEPRLFSAHGPMGMFMGQLVQSVASVQHASLVRETTQGGAYLLEGRLTSDDLKGLFASMGFVIFGATRSMPGAGGHPVPPHVSPYAP